MTLTTIKESGCVVPDFRRKSFNFSQQYNPSYGFVVYDSYFIEACFTYTQFTED